MQQYAFLGRRCWSFFKFLVPQTMLSFVGLLPLLVPLLDFAASFPRQAVQSGSSKKSGCTHIAAKPPTVSNGMGLTCGSMLFWVVSVGRFSIVGTPDCAARSASRLNTNW